MLADIPATPVKPKNPAIIANTKKTTINCNIGPHLFKRDVNKVRLPQIVS